MIVPFEIVRRYDEALDELDVINEFEYLSRYLILLKNCGWSVIDYEKELLKTIDLEWMIMFNKLNG